MTLVEPIDHYLAPRTMQAVQATKSPVVALAQQAIAPQNQGAAGNNFTPATPRPTGSVTPLPPVPQNPANNGGDKSGGGGPQDYSADGFLQSTLGLLGQQLGGQLAGLSAQEKSELLRFGDPNLASKILGLGKDDPFIRSISSNPDTSFSTLAQLAKAYRDNSGRFNEAENNNNLWYSGHRVKGLGELAYANNKNVDSATQTVQGNLTKINQGRIAAQQAYDQARVAAEQGAYDRAISLAGSQGQATLDPAQTDTKGLADLTNYWLRLGAPTTVTNTPTRKGSAAYGTSLVKAIKAQNQPTLKPVSGGFFLGGRGGRL
jgi:hypothetical protein